jgi:hypothetical protein
MGAARQSLTKHNRKKGRKIDLIVDDLKNLHETGALASSSVNLSAPSKFS